MCESGKLEELLDLGHTPPADNFLTKDDLQNPETSYPLKVLFCTECGLSQLSYVVSPDVLFSENYPYESSTTRYFKNHFNGLAKTVAMRFSLGEGDLAVDVGSNVGVLLGGFKSQGLSTVGVEPVGPLAAKAEADGLTTINAFLDGPVSRQIVSSHGHAAVVTATNVFAHIDDLTTATRHIKDMLRQDGVFVIEVPYFLELLNSLEYDTIYHEHLSYILVTPLRRFFARVGLEVFDVEDVPMHGVSLRVYVGFPGKHPVSERVGQHLRQEADKGTLKLDTLQEFSDRVQAHRWELSRYLFSLKTQGKRIAGISAPAKGNTLLNYCNINSDILDYLTERSPRKIGLFSPGKHIPVVDDDVLKDDQPDYGLLLAWNLRDEIMKNLSFFRERGGRFIVPMPRLETI